MCGICGMIGYTDEKLLNNMMQKLEHRGPDGSGTYFDYENRIALGHLRLSILDLSENGKQPMISEDKNLIITYNGEIYNYIEIRKELECLGYRFLSGTDTEVILYAYKEWKEKCLLKFNGMFAFAIWDKANQRLFCARDRLGVKPLYYFYGSGVLLFASEIKAILEYNKLEKVPNDQIIYDYLVDGFVEHNNETFFKGIYKLPPGNYMIVKTDAEHEIIKYWDVDISNDLLGEEKADRFVQNFYNLFEDSVKLRLRSDVPIGSCLSGGLDSSSIVCKVNQLLELNAGIDKSVIGEKQKIFSSCFEDKKFDEREFIEEAVSKTKVDKNYIFTNSDDLVNEIEKLVYYQEEPFLGTSIYAQWSVMKAAREKGVKVLLDGQGADEILCGYRKFRIYIVKEYIKSGLFLRAFKELLSGITQFRKSYNLKQDLYKIFRIFNVNKEFEFKRYINNEFINRHNSIKRELVSDIFQASYLDVKKYSLPALLRYEDKNSMAFSIEARVPFLDYRLVEFAFKIPAIFKIRNGWSKWILREAMKGIVPEKIRLRKDKMGFVTTEQKWISEKRDFFTSLFFCDNPRCSKYVNLGRLCSDFDKILDGKINANVWRIINLELWLRAFFG